MRDLSDAFDWIRRIMFRLDRIEGGAMLENASITRGRLRFIGGLLRVDSGGAVEIVGTLQVDGTSTVTGQFTVEGPWNLTGDGTITGAVSIEGPVTISGDVDLTGLMNVTGDIVVDGTGSIKVEGTGSIEVTGSGGIVVSADGKITVGNMVLDPSSNGGSITFTGGPEIYAAGGQLALYSTGAWIELDGTMAKIIGPGVRWIEITSSSIRLVGLPTAPQDDWDGSFPGAVVADSSGNLFRIVP